MPIDPEQGPPSDMSERFRRRIDAEVRGLDEEWDQLSALACEQRASYIHHLVTALSALPPEPAPIPVDLGHVTGRVWHAIQKEGGSLELADQVVGQLQELLGA